MPEEQQQELIVRPQTDIESTCQNTLLDVLKKYKRTIDSILPGGINPKRFAWLAVQAVRSNPALASCSPSSFLNAVILATQMGLEIRRDSCYLIPFSGQVTLLIDWKAKCTLARRNGKVGGIQAVCVRESDDFDWHYDKSGVVFHHRPQWDLPEDERGRPTYFYAFAELIGGGIQFREPMSLREIDKRRKLSRAGVSELTIDQIFEANALGQDRKPLWSAWPYKDKRRQPWVCWFIEQSLKTALHSLCKSLPLDPGAQLSQEVDSGIETGEQPNVLGDAVDIDPVDQRPMVQASAEEQQRIMEEKLAQGREQAKEKKEAKKARSVARAYDDFPVEVTPGLLIYVKDKLYRGSEDAIGWNPVEQ